MRKLIFAFLVVYGHNAFGQSNNSESNRYTSDRFSIQASLGNNFDLYQPLSDANLVLIPIRDFRSFYTEFDRFAWNLQGQVSYALNPVWNLYAGGSLGTMSGSNNTDYYRASLFSVDMGMKYNLSNIRIRPRKTRWQLLPLIGVTYNYFSSDLYYLFDETSQHTESGDVFGFNIGTELHFALHKNISVFGSFVRRGFRSDGLDGWDYGGNGDDYFRTNIGVRLKLVRSSKSEHASDVNLWEAVNNNYSQNITNNSSKSSGSKKPVFDFCTRLEMYVVGDKDDYDGRKINNPTLYVVRGETYYFKNCDELSPLRISKKKHARSRPSGLAKNGIKPEDGLVPFRIPIDAQDEYYYYSDANDSIGGIIKVLGVNEDGDINNFKKLVNNLNDEMQKLKIKIAKDSRDTTLNIINSHSQPPAQDEFDFDFKNDNYVVGDKEDYEDGKNTNPKLYVVRGASYKIKNASDDHPLRLSKSKDGREKPSGLESNGIKDDDGSVNWKIPLDAPDEYYYYSDANDSIGGVIKVLGDESDEMDLLNQRIKEINDELNKLKVAQGKTPESNSSDTTINITNVQMVAPAVDDFVFNDQDDKYVVGDDSQYEGGINENPTLYVVRGSSYNIRNNSKDQPLRVSKKDGERDDPKGLGANGITEGDGSVTWKIPFDAPNEYYYYSDADDKLRGTIKVLGESSGDTTMNITNIQTAVPSEEDDFTFGFDNDKYVVGDDSDYEDGKNENPTLYVVRGADYKIRNDSDDQPLRFSKKKGERDNPKGLDSNGITSEDGSVNWKVPLDAPEEYYYYSDASDTIGGTIKVLGGNSSDTTIYITNIQSAGDSSSDDFVFNDQDDRYVVGDKLDYEKGINENPTLYVVRGLNYKFKNNSDEHPLRISTKDGRPASPRGIVSDSITKDDGSVNWKIPLDAPDEYYYYSEANDTLRGVIKVMGGEGNTEGDVYDVDLTQDFNKLIKDLQDKMEMELSNLKSQDDVDRFEGGQHLVLFYNVDIHILTKEQKKKIFEFVYKLKKESIGFEYKMIISGFADERASAAYNDALRQRRSNEVKKFFKQLGLVVPTEDRTATHTYTGEMFLDRRVELTVEVL